METYFWLGHSRGDLLDFPRDAFMWGYRGWGAGVVQCNAWVPPALRCLGQTPLASGCGQFVDGDGFHCAGWRGSGDAYTFGASPFGLSLRSGGSFCIGGAV